MLDFTYQIYKNITYDNYLNYFYKLHYYPEKAELDLSAQNIDDQFLQEVLLPFLEVHPEITSLKLGENLLTTAGIKALAANTTLTKLDLQYSNNLEIAAVEALGANNTLIELNLSGCMRYGAGVGVGKAFANNRVLTTLYLARNHLTNEDIIALASNQTLIKLDISLNDIDDNAFKALATHPTLTTLIAHYTGLSDEGAKALAANTILTDLDVSFNQIGDAGAIELARNRTLRNLNLFDNWIQKGIVAFSMNTTLVNLNIGQNHIDEASVIAILANATLHNIAMYYCLSISIDVGNGVTETRPNTTYVNKLLKERKEVREVARVLGQMSRDRHSFFLSKDVASLIAARVADTLPIETAEKIALGSMDKPR